VVETAFFWLLSFFFFFYSRPFKTQPSFLSASPSFKRSVSFSTLPAHLLLFFSCQFALALSKGFLFSLIYSPPRADSLFPPPMIEKALFLPPLVRVTLRSVRLPYFPLSPKTGLERSAAQPFFLRAFFSLLLGLRILAQ